MIPTITHITTCMYMLTWRVSNADVIINSSCFLWIVFLKDKLPALHFNLGAADTATERSHEYTP